MTGRADQSSFVIRRGVKSSDIPENKLLRHFLEQIDETIGEALKFVGESEKGLPNEFRALRSDVTRALKNPYLSEVSRVTRATAQMRQRARRARQAEYRELATLQVAFDRVFRWSRWESILRLVTSGWIEPIKDDDLFELYALVQVLNALKVDLRLGEPVTYGLIRTNRGRIAVFQGVGGMRVDVFFDQAPSTVIQGTLQSEYVGTLSCYEGFAPKQRRPDITLVVTRPGEDARVLFIECKDSDDPEYRYTSVYKALGYVKDFRALWSGHEQQKPKVVLVYPEPVHPKPGGSDAAWDVALVCADDRTRMAALITGVLDHANAP